MEESTADAFVNRGEPIPVIEVAANEALSSDSDRRRDRIKKKLSSSKLKEKFQHVGAKRTEPGSSLQDRLFAK